jgi:hypothetical protein
VDFWPLILFHSPGFTALVTWAIRVFWAGFSLMLSHSSAMSSAAI